MAAFSGGVSSALHFEDIRQHELRTKGIRKQGCFSLKRDKSLRDRIKHYNIWYNEQEDQRAKEYSQRRSAKTKQRKLVTREVFVRRLRWLYLFTFIVWVVGLIMTFCSTVESIGKGTVFFDNKETYRIVGPLVLFAGMLLLFLTEGLKMNFKINEGLVQPNYNMLRKSNKKLRKNSIDSGNAKDIETINFNTSKRKLYNVHTHKCNSIEELNVKAYQKSHSKQGETNSTGTNSSGAACKPNGSHTNYKDQWTQVSFDVAESDTDPNEDVSNQTSSKGKKRELNRFHWAKLSQESTGSDIGAIDENETMLSSGDSANFRYELQEMPRSPSSTFENPIARQWSLISATSATSKYSNFNDDAPLIKR